MNILPLDYLRSHGQGPLPNRLPEGTDLVGIRPEHLFLDPPLTPALPIPARLELIEPAGGECHLHLRAPGLAQVITVRVHNRPNLAEGTELALFMPHTLMHPFEGGRGGGWHDASGGRVGAPLHACNTRNAVDFIMTYQTVC